MSGRRGGCPCPRLGPVLRADGRGRGRQEREAGPVPTSLSPGCAPLPGAHPSPRAAPLSHAPTEVLSGSPERVMRGLAWGRHPREGFNCWGDQQEPPFGYMMYQLFFHGPVTPTVKMMDFRHTRDWFETWLCFLLGVRPGTASPSRVSASSLRNCEGSRSGRAQWETHAAPGGQPHRTCLSVSRTRGVTCAPRRLPSRPPRLRHHFGRFRENDGSHRSERWQTMPAPVFCPFLHLYFDPRPVCCEVRLLASLLCMELTGGAGAKWLGNKDMARGHLPPDSVTAACARYFWACVERRPRVGPNGSCGLTSPLILKTSFRVKR